MSAIDILEKRVEELEKQILGKRKQTDVTQTIADQLIQTKVMISSALSLRESITSLLEKMPKVNEYLDPTLFVGELESEVKRQYVLLLYPELKETAELLQKFNGLKSVLDSKHILQVNDSMGKLNELAAANLVLYEKSRDTTNDILKALQAYNDIIMSIRKLFADLDQSITELEISRLPKAKIDD